MKLTYKELKDCIRETLYRASAKGKTVEVEAGNTSDAGFKAADKFKDMGLRGIDPFSIEIEKIEAEEKVKYNSRKDEFTLEYGLYEKSTLNDDEIDSITSAPWWFQEYNDSHNKDDSLFYNPDHWLPVGSGDATKHDVHFYGYYLRPLTKQAREWINKQ